MVQINKVNRRPSTAEQWNQALSSGANAIENYGQVKQQREQQLQSKGKMNEYGQSIGVPNLGEYPLEIQKEIVSKSLSSGLKQETLLQKEQRLLAEQRRLGLESQQKRFSQIFPGMENDQQIDTGSSEERKEKSQTGLQNYSDEKLREISSYKGQPGEMGIYGNEADRILTDRKEKEKSSPEYIRNQKLAEIGAQTDSKYYNDLNEKRSKQILKKTSLDRLESMNKKGTTGKAYENVLEKFGLISRTSEGRREFAAEVKNQFTDFKAIAGSQLSAQEFFVLTNAYPSPDFSKEANSAIISNLKEVHDVLDKEYEIATKLKKQNKGQLPESIQEKVNEEMKKYVSEKMNKIRENTKTIMHEQYGIPEGFSLMFDKNGDPLSVPNDKVVEILEQGMADLP